MLPLQMRPQPNSANCKATLQSTQWKARAHHRAYDILNRHFEQEEKNEDLTTKANTLKTEAEESSLSLFHSTSLRRPLHGPFERPARKDTTC